MSSRPALKPILRAKEKGLIKKALKLRKKREDETARGDHAAEETDAAEANRND
jgi:hypothetical protein